MGSEDGNTRRRHDGLMNCCCTFSFPLVSSRPNGVSRSFPSVHRVMPCLHRLTRRTFRLPCPSPVAPFGACVNLPQPLLGPAKGRGRLLLRSLVVRSVVCDRRLVVYRALLTIRRSMRIARCHTYAFHHRFTRAGDVSVHGMVDPFVFCSQAYCLTCRELALFDCPVRVHRWPSPTIWAHLVQYHRLSPYSTMLFRPDLASMLGVRWQREQRAISMDDPRVPP